MTEVSIAVTLADSFERQIRDGAFKPGDKLPSLRELAQHRRYAKNTVLAAFELLVSRGLVEPRRERPSWSTSPATTYYPLFGKLKLADARIAGVPRLADGPDLEALEALLLAHKPRLFFTQSVAHNPTGSDLAAGKALRVLQWRRSTTC